MEKENKLSDIIPSRISFNQTIIKWSTVILVQLLLVYVIVLVVIIFGTNVPIYDEIINSYTILGEIFIGIGVVLGIFLVLNIIVILLMNSEKELRDDFEKTAIAPLSDSPKSLDVMEIKIGENLTKKQYRKNTKTKVFTAFGTLGIGLLVVGFATGFIMLDNFQKPIPVKYIQTADPSDVEHATPEGKTMVGFTSDFNEDWTKNNWNTLSIPPWVDNFELTDGLASNVSFSEVFNSIDSSEKLNKSITNLRMSNDMTFANNIFPTRLFEDCNIKSTINFPKSLETIGSNAFSGNHYGTAINFGTHLKTIGADAFQNFGDENTNVKNILRFPSSLEHIGVNAFQNFGNKDSGDSIVEFTDCTKLLDLNNNCFDMFKSSNRLDVFMPNVNINFTWKQIFGTNLASHKQITLHLPKYYEAKKLDVAAAIGIGPEDIVLIK